VLNLGTGEVLLILVVALVVLGPDKLPGAARQAGRWIAELRRLSSGFQSELRDAIQEPVDFTPRPAPSARPAPAEPEADAGTAEAPAEPAPDPGPG
jgi:sec-independent protein translocase protein TatB